MKVLFICRANVGRSQIAEVIFNSLAEEKHIAISTGTKVGEKDGQTLRERGGVEKTLTVLNEIDLDVLDNVRTQLTEEILANVDVVVSMIEPNECPEFLKNDTRTIYWKIVDPYKQTLEFTRDTRDKITALVKELLVRLN